MKKSRDADYLSLKDGSITYDQRLDRCVQFDDRSRNFRIMPGAVEQTWRPRSYTWRIDERLDQGAEGACVGFAMAHELAARPSEVANVTNEVARSLYHYAQRIDPWPGGSYPDAVPVYEGTSILAGAKTLVIDGWCEGYRWGFGLNDLIYGVGHNGPAVLGISWCEGMSNTDADGFIHAIGNRLGGHAILCVAVNVMEKYFTLVNSWGIGWGFAGECKVSFEDMGKLLADQGEAVFMLHRHRVAE